MKNNTSSNRMWVGKTTRMLIMFAAIMAFVACDRGKEVAEKVADGAGKVAGKIGEGADKVEYKMYDAALQKVLNELNKQFPQTIYGGAKVEGLSKDEKYVNVNLYVEENAMLSLPVISEQLKENKGELISEMKKMLKANDNKDFMKDLGLPFESPNMTDLVVRLLKKTNREIAICARGSINTEKVIVTTISPDDLK